MPQRGAQYTAGINTSHAASVCSNKTASGEHEAPTNLPHGWGRFGSCPCLSQLAGCAIAPDAEVLPAELGCVAGALP